MRPPGVTESYRTIVIGSGSAGLFVALEAMHLGPVLLLTKAAIEDSNTSWAQGGVAAAIGPLDSPAQHLSDTVAAGAGLVDEEAARVLCNEGPAVIRALADHGVPFDRAGEGLALGREAAHSRPRIVHARGDQTGAAIEDTLAAAAGRRTGITIREHAQATRLLVERNHIAGIEAAQEGHMVAFEAPNVVLATGGAGQLFSHTTNPEVATGDGISLAFDAGAEVADLEFFQFHPTALRVPGVRPFLISETVRGEGAVLRNAAGEAFMPRYHPLADLAPRDVVARAIVREMRAAGTDHVTLDCSAAKVELDKRFPGIFAFCLGAGIDIRTTPIPIAPAAHYYMGGVRTDTRGRTTVQGLYACGEAACTGVHGANRLASNSLLETVVFGKRVVEHIRSGDGGAADPSPEVLGVGRPFGELDAGRLRALMWEYAGIERTGAGLSLALAELESASEAPHRTREMTTVAALLVRAALARTESRGAHYRRDFPQRDDSRWQRRQVFRRAD
ncbi:MAG: L-aspartate oxidase [Chloroflexi bacterium]|nr:L-aspartate oxidase [Chloroflexota bacterium]